MKWEKKGLILAPSDIPEYGFTHIQGPVAIELENKIRIYFGSRIKNGSSRVFYMDLNAGNPKEIIRISRDPLFDGGLPGTFDQDGVLQVSVNRNGADLYMYYVGFSKLVNAPHTCMMGLAISKDDGITFKKYSEGPIFAISTIDPYLIGSGDVIFHDSMWHLIYTSGTRWFFRESKFEYTYSLKYAYSNDGINWQPTGHLVIPQKTEYQAYTSPTIFKKDGLFHMFFSTRNAFNYRIKGENAYKLGYAFSQDLVNWIQSDNFVGLGASIAGWDSQMICYSNVLELNGRFIMFYNGNEFGKSGMGYAILVSD